MKVDDLGIPLFSETPIYIYPFQCFSTGRNCLVVFPSTTTELATVHQPGKVLYIMNDGISSAENGPSWNLKMMRV